MEEGNSSLISNSILKQKVFQPPFFITVKDMELPPLHCSEDPGVSYPSRAPQGRLGTAKPAYTSHALTHALQGCDI